MLYHQAPTLISWDDVYVGEGAEDMIGDDTIAAAAAADDKDEDFVAVRPKARPDVLRPVFQQKGLQWLRALTLPYLTIGSHRTLPRKIVLSPG